MAFNNIRSLISGLMVAILFAGITPVQTNAGPAKAIAGLFKFFKKPHQSASGSLRLNNRNGKLLLDDLPVADLLGALEKARWTEALKHPAISKELAREFGTDHADIFLRHAADDFAAFLARASRESPFGKIDLDGLVQAAKVPRPRTLRGRSEILDMSLDQPSAKPPFTFEISSGKWTSNRTFVRMGVEVKAGSINVYKVLAITSGFAYCVEVGNCVEVGKRVASGAIEQFLSNDTADKAKATVLGVYLQENSPP